MSKYILENPEEVERLERQSQSKHYSVERELRHVDLKLGKDSRVLDAGCGSGLLVRYLKQKYPQSRITGIDISELRIQQAKNLSKDFDVEYRVGDLQTLKSEKKFDLIICRYVLQHSLEAKLIIQTLRNLLSDGGKLLLIDSDGFFFNIYSEDNDFTRMLEELKSKIMLDLDVGRKLPTYLKELKFLDIDYHIEVEHFKNEHRVEEIENFRQRFLFIMPVLEEILGEDAPSFINKYIAHLEVPENPLFYNKFIVWGTKS